MLKRDGHQLLTSQIGKEAEQSVKVAEQKNHPGYLNERTLCKEGHHSLTSHIVKVVEQNVKMAELKSRPSCVKE